MPTRPLPNNPSLEHLRKDAKRLQSSVSQGHADAVALAREFHPRGLSEGERFQLSDAQLVLARSCGFTSWARLKAHLAAIEPYVWNPPATDPSSTADLFVRLACLTYTHLAPSPDRALRMLEDDPGLGRAGIHAAAAAGDVEAVRGMLDAEPGLINHKGGPLRWEPLLYACYSRMTVSDGRSTLAVARELLTRGADPNAGFLYDGTYAFTALTGAFGRGEDWHNQPPHPDAYALARLLLDAGADPNDAQTLYNRHFNDNDDGYLVLLFEYGLGKDSPGPWIARLNDQPSSLLVVELCAAVQHHFVNRVKLLVEHGVDVNGRSRRTKRTPYEEAVRAGFQGIAEYLAAHGARRTDLDPLETFAMACIAGRSEDVRARLEADPGLLDRLGPHGRLEMLHRAVETGSEAGIRLIVGMGVDVNGMEAGSAFDRSVVHNAAGWGPLRIVRLLVELGADPNLRDLTYHGSAIGWALYNRNDRTVVDYLLPLAGIFDAVQAGSTERVAALLTSDPSRALAIDDLGNPLVFRLRPDMPGLSDMITLLASHGVDLNAQDRDGRTIVDLALSRGLTEFADALRTGGLRATSDRTAPP